MASDTYAPSSIGPTLLNRMKRHGSTILKARNKKSYWPNSEQSVGSLFGSLDGENYWRLKDTQCTAYIAFQKLVQDLDATLEKHTEAPLKHVLWRAYMIGESACLCALGIIFCCADTEYRKAAKSCISESCAIVVSSGVLVKYRSEPPQSRGLLVPMAGDDKRPPSQLPQSSMMPNLARRSPGNTLCYLATSVDLEPGQALHVVAAGGVQATTLGGMVKIHGIACLMTAAHSFTARVSQDPVRNRNTESAGFENMVTVGGLLFSSILDGCPELDYALIQIKEGVSLTGGSVLIPSPNGYFRFPSFTAEVSLKSLPDKTITSTTASAGTVHGQIETTPDLMRPPGAKKSHEVHAVQFEHSLAEGDSGSWVVASESGILHGHIVAGVPQDGLAFIVPAHAVFADVERAFAATDTHSWSDCDPGYRSDRYDLDIWRSEQGCQEIWI